MTSTQGVNVLWLVLAVGACSGPDRESNAPADDANGGDTVTADVVDAVGVASLDSATLERARSAASALGKGLMQSLLAEMESGGTDAALAFCADSAQALTARYQQQGVNVHRTSLQIRNPDNAPDGAERRVLLYLDSLHSTNALPTDYAEVLRSADGSREARYYRPIMVVEGCLRCHGAAESIAPEVRSVLAERYPSDAATGYAVGDLRGVVAVRLPLP
jgi:hypothetical protein